MKAIRVHRHGGPDVLAYEDVDIGPPGPGEDVLAMSEELFHVVSSGAVQIPVHARMPLAEVAEAHRRLEARETAGATVLLP